MKRTFTKHLIALKCANQSTDGTDDVTLEFVLGSAELPQVEFSSFWYGFFRHNIRPAVGTGRDGKSRTRHYLDIARISFFNGYHVIW